MTDPLLPAGERISPSQGALWAVLKGIRSVRFIARSGASTGWEGAGEGTVAVTEPAPDALIFEESGVWHPRRGLPGRFTNTFRWSLAGGGLRLEHLRFGPDRPVFLFEMAPDRGGVWREVSPHTCGHDCYSATLRVDGENLIVHWTVAGPRKSESIEYTYR